MPQETALFPEFTVDETFAFFARLYSVPAAERDRKAQQLLALLNLGDLRGRRISQLSGGQARRVSLCCALLHRCAEKETG